MTPAIILDLDGTLYSSRELDRENEEAAVLAISDAKDIHPNEAATLLTLKRQTKFGQTSISEAVKKIGVNDEKLKRYQISRMKPEKHLKADDELVKLVRELKRSFKIILLTNTRREMVQRIIGILGFSENDFSLIAAGGDGYQPKPSKETIQKVMNLVGASPSDSYSIGDRWLVDLKPAVELGIKTVLVHSRDDLVMWLRSKITTDID